MMSIIYGMVNDMKAAKFKLSVFINYLILFFSMIFVVIFLYLGFNIILVSIYENNYFVSKNSAEFLASIMNYVFSTTNNLTIEIIFPKTEMKFFFFENNITVKKGNDQFSSKIFKPNYISLILTNNEIETTTFFNTVIIIHKINNEIRIVS